MLQWNKVVPAAVVLLLTGCVTSEQYAEKDSSARSLQKENANLQTLVTEGREWRQDLLRFEDKINRLEVIIEPLAPLKAKQAALMETNAREGEEAGGGSLSEIFYLVQTAYSELDLQAANLANDINNTFDRDDFIQLYLFGELEDKVVDMTLEISEVVVRRSSHMATDRRLVTARLKALHECFMALRNLSENKAFDLSYKQRMDLLLEADHVRVEYAKTLKTDYFPAIPHFVPLASGEDYLKGLDKMSSYISDASRFYKDPNAKKTDEVYEGLSKSLAHKKNILKADTIK